LAADDVEWEPAVARREGPTERAATVRMRLCQGFFRRAVLASYEYSCTVCGMDLRPLLVASHIVPWSISKAHRTDPDNGLCLCALHDRAFDRGLIGVGEALEVLVSPAAKASRSGFARTALTAFEGRPIKLPTRFAPRLEHLRWHREAVFSSQCGPGSCLWVESTSRVG
jgi:predicted restriction endonuclease